MANNGYEETNVTQQILLARPSRTHMQQELEQHFSELQLFCNCKCKCLFLGYLGNYTL